MRVLGLCSGIGGLELGVKLALGGRARTVCYVEREAYAQAILLARMADSSLERAPVWDDLTTFDAGRWRGAVDLVTAGFPCQPWSVAGKRKGTADERWIWPDIMRIIRECEAPLVFLENVPGLVRHGLRAVLSDLAAAGFDAEWLCLSAADIGAPHRRERVFVLAYRDNGGRHLRRCSQQEAADEYAPLGASITPPVSDPGRHLLRLQPGWGSAGWANPAEPGDVGEGLGDADGQGRGPSRRPGTGAHEGRPLVAGGHPAVAHAEHEGQRLGGSALHDHGGDAPGDDAHGCHALLGSPSSKRPQGTDAGRGKGWPAGRPFPPGPGDDADWREWLAAGGPEPAVRRGAHGIADRVDRLRALGNAVVPLQAATAFRELLCRVTA